jgi:two-component system, OmpR family, phosphate regulon sensor histidine kinase PhoR
MARRRLLWQIYPTYLLVTLIAVSAVSWYAIRSLSRFYHEAQATELEGRARLVAETVRLRTEESPGGNIDDFCKRLGPPSGTRITLIDATGRVLGDSEQNPEEMDNHGGRPEVLGARAEGVGVSVRFSHSVQRDLMYVAIPGDEAGLPGGAVRVAFSVESIEGALRGTVFDCCSRGWVWRLSPRFFACSSCGD